MNDVGILDAARSVFLEDPSAPISAVASRANVGISAITLPGADGGHALRHRYLALLLQALRAPGAGPLPAGPGPAELTGRWSGRQ